MTERNYAIALSAEESWMLAFLNFGWFDRLLNHSEGVGADLSGLNISIIPTNVMPTTLLSHMMFISISE